MASAAEDVSPRQGQCSTMHGYCVCVCEIYRPCKNQILITIQTTRQRMLFIMWINYQLNTLSQRSTPYHFCLPLTYDGRFLSFADRVCKHTHRHTRTHGRSRRSSVSVSAADKTVISPQTHAHTHTHRGKQISFITHVNHVCVSRQSSAVLGVSKRR